METYLKFTIDVDNCKKNLYDRYTDLESILTLAKYKTSYIWQFIDWSVRNFISMLRPGYGLSSNPRIDIKSRALYHSDLDWCFLSNGEMSEWFKVAALKAAVAQVTGGSNPSLSARGRPGEVRERPNRAPC